MAAAAACKCRLECIGAVLVCYDCRHHMQRKKKNYRSLSFTFPVNAVCLCCCCCCCSYSDRCNLIVCFVCSFTLFVVALFLYRLRSSNLFSYVVAVRLFVCDEIHNLICSASTYTHTHTRAAWHVLACNSIRIHAFLLLVVVVIMAWSCFCFPIIFFFVFVVCIYVQVIL